MRSRHEELAQDLSRDLWRMCSRGGSDVNAGMVQFVEDVGNVAVKAEEFAVLVVHLVDVLTSSLEWRRHMGLQGGI